MTDTLHCLDLFCGLGGFSQAFADSERWAVTTVDIDERFAPDIQADVLDLRPSDFERDFDVVLASPPCTDFSLTCMTQKWDIDQMRAPAYLPAWESISESIGVVFHTLYLIQELGPAYWFLENPRWGALRQFIGEPAATVHYCQYGSDYKKPTALWGQHPPMNYRQCPGDVCDHLSNPSEQNEFRDATRLADVVASAERAKVPRELSEAIREAVAAAIDDPPPTQAELPVEVHSDD